MKYQSLRIEMDPECPTKKHVLVTGGAGYIGSHAAKALANSGYVPVTYDSLVNGHRWAVRWGPFLEGDIGDKARLLEAMHRYETVAVIHFAAFAYVGESMKRPVLYFENNVTKSLALLDAEPRLGCAARRFLFKLRNLWYASADANRRRHATTSGKSIRRDQADHRTGAPMVWLGV